MQLTNCEAVLLRNGYQTQLIQSLAATKTFFSHHTPSSTIAPTPTLTATGITTATRRTTQTVFRARFAGCCCCFGSCRGRGNGSGCLPSTEIRDLVLHRLF